MYGVLSDVIAIDGLLAIPNCPLMPSPDAEPELTAVNHDVDKVGRLACNLLIDYLEKRNEFSPVQSSNDIPFELVKRNSCAKVPRGVEGI